MGNTPAKLRAHLIKIDLLKTGAEAEIEQLFKDAHSNGVVDGPVKNADPAKAGDYDALMSAVFEYCYGEYAEAKRGRNQDIVHPVEVDVIKRHVKEALSPGNTKEITLENMKKHLKKLVDDTDYNEQDE